MSFSDSLYTYQVKIELHFKLSSLEQSWFENNSDLRGVIVAKARENSYTEKCYYLNSPCVLLDRLVHYHIPTCPETLGIYFNIYNPLFILTGYKQGVSHLHFRADSTQAAGEVRQTHGLTDFKRSICPNKSSGIIGALRC